MFADTRLPLITHHAKNLHYRYYPLILLVNNLFLLSILPNLSTMQALNDFFKLHNDTENKYSYDLFPSGVAHPDFIYEHRTS